MTTNIKLMMDELYVEHLEEAAYHYETRQTWLVDDTLGWLDLYRLDLSIEAHIDALVVGDIQALQVCLEHLADADPPMLFIIVSVFCRHKSIGNLSKIWPDFDFEDREKVEAVAEALRLACPEEWLGSLLKVVEGDNKAMFPVVAPSIARLARGSVPKLLSLLTKCEKADLPVLLDAISKCDRSVAQQCIAMVGRLVNSSSTDVLEQSTKALLIMGEARALPHIKGQIDKIPMLFALGGGMSETLALLQLAKKGVANEDVILALGFCGVVDVVSSLLAYLKHPDLSLVAAQALYIMTGAPLFETVHVPDEVEEDELFEHEIDAFRKGELPKNIDGIPYGVEVQRLCVDPEIWNDWLKQNRSSFERGLRYRGGRPYSPEQLLNDLISNQMNYPLRQFVYEELVVRYGLDIPFSASDWVYDQRNTLGQIQQWCALNSPRFAAGEWYFASNKMAAGNVAEFPG